MSTVIDINIQKEVSCRVTNSVLKYLESKGYNCDSIADGLPYPYTKEYLSDPLNWITYKILETICRRAAELTDDDAIMYKVGLSIPTLNPLGGLETVFRKLTGPKMVYRFIPKYARLLDHVFTFKTTVTRKNSATIEMRPEEPEYKLSKDSCYFTQGILAAIPTLWGLPPAEIHEKKCMYMPLLGTSEKDVQQQAEACVYRVQWQPSPSWFRRFLDNIVGRVHFVPATMFFRELKPRFQQIDEKNTELIARNKQLAIVREIAMSIEKVNSVDEALNLIVEQAREIEGIRFVLVQTLDESGEYVTTPYYSKIRSRGKVNDVLKAMGIEPEKLLGEKPDSKKLRFQLSKIKIIQDYKDYISNPRVLVVESLADLCDGVFPRALCNAVQTLFMIKKNVVVPLLVENKLWGIMIFELTRDVPIDILEMIGTHCGLALNNIINVKSLVARNTELTARNIQLAAVREIAMGVDKVRTIDEALTLAVERARDIEGIRFVLIQNLDETGKYITTPYYSKIRPRHNVANALKATDVNPEKLLGKNPTSNKLRFEVSKIKIAQDFIDNPRVIVMTSLADLLDGAMSRTLCNAIQSILKVEKLVMVPLLVENKLWGEILYFLTQDVPIDMLEMIGAHCALALNNIINVNNLVARNTELTARNSQLATVREIALGIDKVRTIDEALSFVVDQAREIEGVRFVLVQKLDESKEFVITPYYSRVRPQFQFMADAVKALGFDLDKELGKIPTSNKLRFRFSKLKAAQDYVKSPRVMVFPSLAELLDGIWPRTLCNGIQKIMGVKKLVVVPILVESESWGNLLFFLTQDVPLDILEMIGAHCGLAVKNIGYMEALATEAVRKRILIDESLDGIVILDDNAAVVEANQRFAEMLGYTLDEVRKLHTWEWDVKWKTERLLEMGRKVGSGSEGLHLETQHRRKDGTIIDVDISVNGAVCDGQKLIFCVCRDVTERKKIERALKESEEKFSKAFHASPEAIAIVAVKDEKYIDINDNYIKMFGFSRKELIGNKAFLDNWANPEDHTKMHRILQEQGRIYNQEFDYRTKSGEIRTRLLSLEPITINGEPCRIGCSIDITERKKAQETLQKEQAFLSNILTSIQDGISVLDNNLNIVRVNEGVNKRFAQDLPLIGKKCYEAYHKRSQPCEACPARQTLQTGKVANEVTPMYGPDGTISGWTEANTYPVFDTQTGEITGVIDYVRDITERRRMVEALQESEERYRTIFESANDVLILIDGKGKIMNVNSRIKDIGGYDPEELIGKNIRSLSSIMTKKSLLIVVGNFLKRMAGFEVPFYDVEMIKKNGEHLIIQINAMAVRKEGEIIGDLAILRDVTEIKQAEKNLKLQKDLIDRILATIPNAVLLLNRSLHVIIANQTFYNLFKLKKNQVENKPINELIKTPELDQAIIKVLSSKKESTSTEFRYLIGSSEKMLLINVFAMEEEYLLLVINDVTEEHEKQERLYLTDRLVSVGEMAAGVAHEINNPLTSVIGLSSFLSKQDIPDSVKEDLHAIYSEAQRCASIVKNLLTFARKHVSKKEPQHIPQIVADVLKLRAYEHKVNNITVETAFPPDLPEVIADYFEIQQVFINIILNAEAAMIEAHGRGTLKITGKAVNSHITISFSDDGPGISKENMRFIFNPFFTTKEVGKGTGLGLSICYGIVASHGGKIYAKSEFGKGATFVVELPAYGESKRLNV